MTAVFFSDFFARDRVDEVFLVGDFFAFVAGRLALLLLTEAAFLVLALFVVAACTWFLSALLLVDFFEDTFRVEVEVFFGRATVDFGFGLSAVFNFLLKILSTSHFSDSSFSSSVV